MVNLNEFTQRHEAVKAVEYGKDKLIEDLIAEVKQLQAALDLEKEGMEDQRTLAKAIKFDLKKYKSDMEDMQRKQSKLSFVSVLIDGDCMNFHDDFVQDGQRGGRSAARLLTEKVQRYIQDFNPEAGPNVQYRIRVYANVRGLAKTYRDTNTITEDGTLDSFIQGFNMEGVFCDFVDAGNGKECSDVKINALLESEIVDVHCLHVVFCASADNGYARVLGRHRGSEKVSLVEGPPFAREIRELASEFETTSFPEVFRPQKLSRRVSFGSAPLTPTGTPVTNYASIVRIPPRPQEEASSSTPISALPTGPSAKGKTKLGVHRNASGQRVDSHIYFSSRANLDALKQQKLCNQYHILGSCSYGKGCTHKHEHRLGKEDVADLMYIARLSWTSVSAEGLCWAFIWL
ncbi:uncharacterized protein N7482_007020 [Penicillium canariense]|uniref:C3H1-type domain-containing protein n=1 Tax=Penicillium canariense TaxID=189055 RepID=A0A9W9HYA5_9EURO|nr:uncharacterized protein N7482_007020 [Penicillium canariense]KAJ5160016.1 hypothetical protein N7482_007020 [Penicillium canariense]